MISYGYIQNYNIAVMELMGKSLKKLLLKTSKKKNVNKMCL